MGRGPIGRSEGDRFLEKDISIVIVSWNARDFLLQCLKSILERESRKALEVIVVDNGSTDGSYESVKEAFREVILIQNNENLGFARANNIGILKSTGRYVCLMNSDIQVLGDCLDRMVEYMDENQPVGMLGPRILWGDMKLQSTCRRFPGLWNNFCSAAGLSRLFRKSRVFAGEHMLYFPHDRIQKVDALVGCFMMVRRRALEEVGLLDERFFIYGEDIDWCKRFWKSGWEVVFYPRAESIHYGRKSSSNAPLRFALEQEKAVLQYWKKHHGLFRQQAIKAILIGNHLARIFLGIPAMILKKGKGRHWRQSIEKNLRGLLLLLGVPIEKLNSAGEGEMPAGSKIAG